MKKVAFAVVAALAFAAAPASAADLGRPYAKAPAYVPPAPMLWNGFYIGGHVGYGWGSSAASFGGVAINPTPDPEGVFGGGQIGYNFQFHPNWVVGIEADISAADFTDSVTVGGFTGRSRMDLFGTVRGRIGYAFNNVLFYGTGGFAWGDNELSVNPVPAGIASVSRTHFGYAAGAGIEYAFSPNWSAKLEYLYLAFDRENYGFGLANPVRYDLDMHTVKFGINYRFNWGAPIAAAY